MDTIRTVELFAGVGGFRLGLEAASDRFKVIWANQWEPSMREQYAFECYTAHFGCYPDHVCQDIAKAKTTVPDHDLLVGGFPCQDYSIMKKNSDGIEGAKGKLWWQIDDIVKEKRPKYILLENVDRILWSPAKQYGRDFSIILRCLYEKGYSVEWRIINAAEYGQAQRRRRTFIFAYHNQTNLFRGLAENVCVHGIKSMHEHVTETGVFAKAFPVKAHARSYTDNWIDEMSYADVSDVCEHVPFHAMRHTFASNAFHYGMDVKTLASTIGHESVETTLNVYAHSSEQMKRDAAKKIDEAIGTVLGADVTVSDASCGDENCEGQEPTNNADKPKTVEFKPYQPKYRKRGTGSVHQVSKNVWEGRYTPTVNGKRIARNIYADSEEECEVKLEALIREMKAEFGIR